MPEALFVIGLLARVAVETVGATQATPHNAPAFGSPITALPGREADARVATIAFRLAKAGIKSCPVLEPNFGLTLQHLSQFERSDRAGVIAAQAIDRGPGVIAVVPESPATIAGLRPGDVLLAIDGHALPPETALSAPFDAVRARARADTVDDLLAKARTGSIALSLLRDGMISVVHVTPLPACPSRVRLARSNQRNAFADGRHVVLTTGLVARLQNDDELAFVVAHEMAHNILRHATIMRGDGVSHGLGRTLGRSGRVVRETEREADALGGEIMVDAGFDPVRGAAILERLGGGDLGIELFAAHDSAGKRIAALRARVEARNAR